MHKQQMWDNLLAMGVPEQALQVASSLKGYTEETMEEVLFALFGYNDFKQLAADPNYAEYADTSDDDEDEDEDDDECDGSCIERPHVFTYNEGRSFSAVCQRNGCNVMGTGDRCGDGECEGAHRPGLTAPDDKGLDDCPHDACGYGECSWLQGGVNGACDTHGNNEGRCQRS